MKVGEAEFVRSVHEPSGFIRDGRPEIAFVGRSNVGKSSLMNRLLGRKALARTSSTPGRTQTVNYFSIDRWYYFVDLPGYGFAKAAKTDRRRWAALMECYFRQARPRALTIQLVDGKVGATKLDVQARDYLGSLELEPVIVATKIDKVKPGRRAAQLAEIRRCLEPAEAEVIAVSAVTGDGRQVLWKRITAFLHEFQEKPQPMGKR